MIGLLLTLAGVCFVFAGVSASIRFSSRRSSRAERTSITPTPPPEEQDQHIRSATQVAQKDHPRFRCAPMTPGIDGRLYCNGRPVRDIFGNDVRH